MKKLFVIALLVLAASGAAAQGIVTKGQTGANYLVMDTNSRTLMTIPKSASNLMLAGPDGRTATIDFSGGKVTYSGSLPVDDAAKVFFEAFGRRLQDCTGAR